MGGKEAIRHYKLIGVVDSLGAGVPTELAGQRVLVSARELAVRGGCYAEYICVPASAVYVLPDTLDPVDAASLPNLQLVNALWQCHGERPVDFILMTGISGGVGAMLIPFARMKGAQVIGTTATPQKAQQLRAQGVFSVVCGEVTTWPE